MAILIAGNTAVDMHGAEIGMLADDATVVLSATSTRIALQYYDWRDEFSGNFQYDLFGDLAGGTLNAWRETYGGQLVFEVTGAQVPVSTFLNWVATDDNVAAAQTIFAGADSIAGSVFGDRLYGYAGNDTVMAGDGEDSITDTSGDNYLRGGAGNDLIAGGSGYDDVNGNQGDDTITGGAGGDDWLLGGQGNDQITATAGNVILNGNLGNDTVTAGVGNDFVRGGQGDDVLRAGAGDDHLYADRGNDTVTGGSGADVFHFSTGGGADRVTDFNGTEGDRIQLDPGATYSLAQSGADTVLTLASGDTMTLVGVTKTSIAANWILA